MTAPATMLLEKDGWVFDQRVGFIAIYRAPTRECLAGIGVDDDCVYFDAGTWNDDSGSRLLDTDLARAWRCFVVLTGIQQTTDTFKKEQKMATKGKAISREAALNTLRSVCNNLTARCETHYDPAQILQWVEELLSLHTETYFIDSDGNGHMFVVPVAKREDWRRWKDGQAEATPVFPVAPAPAWATYINGPANVIEFYWDGVVRR